MNADAATPAAPTIPPQPPAPVPVPGATAPQVHERPAEPNALMQTAQKAWAGLKEGKVGNPKIIALVLAVAAILGAWWFLANSSKVNDSAMWRESDKATDAENLKKFANDPSNADKPAARIARLNEIRLRKADALRRLSAPKVADRAAAADDLEKVRDELAAIDFLTDPTLKASAFLAAAEAEEALIGIPKKGVFTLDFSEKDKGRGQVDGYVKLLRKASEAIGKDTDAGKEIAAKADKYADATAASDLYNTLVAVHRKFNNPDPIAPRPGTNPFGGGGGLDPTDDPDAPKSPVVVPPNK